MFMLAGALLFIMTPGMTPPEEDGEWMRKAVLTFGGLMILFVEGSTWWHRFTHRRHDEAE